MEEKQAETDKGKTDHGILPATTPAEGIEEHPVPQSDQSNTATKGPNAAHRAWQWTCEKGRNVWVFVKAPESTNVAIAAATIVIAVATIYTYLEIHSGSTQTDKIINANERIASAMESAVGQAGNALNASIDASRTDQRAWVGIIEAGSLPVIKEGSHVDATIVAMNSGKTPALDVVQTAKWRIVSKGTPLDPEKEIRTGKHERQGVIQPGGRRILSSRFDAPLTKAQADAVTSHAAEVFVFGEITYSDVFNTRHMTRFCMKLGINPNGSAIGLTSCDSYNEAN